MRAAGIWALSGLALATALGVRADVTVGNSRCRLTIGDDAVVKSLRILKTGKETVNPSERLPVASVTQDRFYGNENKLAYPCGEVTCRANRIRRQGDLLTVGFETVPYEAHIRVKETEEFVGFELEGFTRNGETFVRAFRLLELPVEMRRNFGEWLNVTWDDSSAVALIGVDPFAKIGAERRNGFRLFSAGLDRELKLLGGRAVLIGATGGEDFLACLDAVESAYDLPRGVRDQRNDVFNSSVFWSAEVTPKNVDEVISLAKRGGFRMMLIYHTAVCTCPGDYYGGPVGDYELRGEYAHGLDSLREMLAKIKAAGIRPGLHLLHPFIGFGSRKYVTPKADHRLNLLRHFTVAKDAGTAGGDLFVEESPAACPQKRAGARLLRFEGEILSYEGFTAERPYRFTGVKRGAKGRTVAPLPKGRIGGLLDVAQDGLGSCYVDQNSSLQDELCDRFAELWACGFEFLCLDGCEGVNAPFQTHVANGQHRVWRKLEPKPLFTEGAARAHFDWHMLSGGNAFDKFSPELFKEMIVKWPMREAEAMRCDFSRVSFGWWGIVHPGERLKAGSRSTDCITVGTQPDMWEFGTSRAAAWDSPTTIQFNLRRITTHPRRDDLLEVIRRWEDVRARKWLTPAQKAALKSPTREHHLYVNERGEYELHEIEMLPPPPKAKSIRAFVFECNGRRVICCWHISGAATIEAPLGPNGASVVREVSSRTYLETSIPREAAIAAWARCECR